jgi:hypothetical protein
VTTSSYIPMHNNNAYRYKVIKRRGKLKLAGRENILHGTQLSPVTCIRSLRCNLGFAVRGAHKWTDVQRWAHKFRKSANLRTNFFRFADLQQMWHVVDLQFADHTYFCDLRTQLFFAGIKLPQIRKYTIFILITSISF